VIVGLTLICRSSYRGVVEFLRDVLGVPVSLGSVHQAWFKTGGLWVTPKVARAAPTKGFHVSRVTRI